MKSIREWIEKNAVLKDGASLDELESFAKDLDPLKNIKTKDEAYDFMLRNDAFKSALDYETQKRVENALNKFKDEKLPDILKSEGEKIRAEINPEETPEQKRIRELEDRIKKDDEERRVNQLKQALREKAKELAEKEKVPYDPLRAERFALFGEDADNMLTDDISYLKKSIETELSSRLKGQYTEHVPKGNIANLNISSLSDAELYSLAKADPTRKAEILSEINRRVSK